MAEEEGMSESAPMKTPPEHFSRTGGEKRPRGAQGWPDKYHVGETVYHGTCNVRIHELSQPKRWLLFNTYKCYNKYFDADRAKAVKEKVQELFSMTPEETELYFNTIRQKKPRKVDVKAIKRKLREERLQAKKEAYEIFHSIVRKALKYAYGHAPPLLVSPMLRIISDHMLEFLAELHKISIPKRTDTDKVSQLLVSAADWCALFVANVYYEIEVEERKEAKQRAELSKVPSTVSAEEETSGGDNNKENTEVPTKVTDYTAADDDNTGVTSAREGDETTEPATTTVNEEGG